MKKRGQVSIEYMVVIGFVTLIILSLKSHQRKAKLPNVIK